jgi:3-deoxy-D-manno-octulosonate 8-phosphate phosphatase (KDO 8-P phosphatase)
MKAFGCDDFDSMKAISKKAEICVITADERGFLIVEKRIKEEMQMPLYLVPNGAKQRWDWIKEKFKDNYEIVYIGDGIYDYYSLRNADLSFTMGNSLFHVKKNASVILRRSGGDRAVAEACIMIDQYYKLGVFDDFYKGEMKDFNRTIGV